MSSGNICVDLDGTLAHYDTWNGPAEIGAPIPAMVERVKRWLSEGREVRIFTARAYPLALQFADGMIRPSLAIPIQYGARNMECERAVTAIRNWCTEHIGTALTITCCKCWATDEIYDDRAVQVEKNTGRLIGQSTRGLE